MEHWEPTASSLLQQGEAFGMRDEPVYLLAGVLFPEQDVSGFRPISSSPPLNPKSSVWFGRKYLRVASMSIKPTPSNFRTYGAAQGMKSPQ